MTRPTPATPSLPSGLHAVSLCAGIGALDLAFHRAGIPTIAAVEKDDRARGVLADQFAQRLAAIDTELHAQTQDSTRSEDETAA